MSDSDITLTEFKTKHYDNQDSKKNYLLMAIIISFSIALVFLTGILKRDIYPFMIFIFLVSLPVIIMFRNQIHKILPFNLADKIEDKADEVVEKTEDFYDNKRMKQIFMIVVIAILNIFVIFLFFQEDFRYSFFKIGCAIMSVIVACILIDEL